MLSSTAPQTSVAPHAGSVDVAVAVDRQWSEAGGEKRGHEDRGGGAVMGVADDLLEQASSRNRVRASRVAGS